MEDAEIVELYWARDERAIGQTRAKYGALCHGIALHVLGNARDAEECVNDAYLGTWNAIPPERPAILSAFVARIARNQALKRWRAQNAQKRGSGSVAVAIDELVDCMPAPGSDVAERLEAAELARLISAYLADEPAERRRIFLCRYFHFDSVAEIAARLGFTESKVKMSLKRTRDGLAAYLQREGVAI